MPADPPLSLSEAQERGLTRIGLACAKCGRRDSYAVARLIERHGDMTLIELWERLTAEKLKARNFEGWCAARFVP
jgi:hypothetical protein